MTKEPAITAKTETVLELLRRKQSEANEEFVLPSSGITCKMSFFSAKKARKAQETGVFGDKVDEDLIFAAMISESCTFNGETMNPHDILDLLPGLDFMTIQGKLGGATSPSENSSS